MSKGEELKWVGWERETNWNGWDEKGRQTEMGGMRKGDELKWVGWERETNWNGWDEQGRGTEMGGMRKGDELKWVGWERERNWNGWDEQGRRTEMGGMRKGEELKLVGWERETNWNGWDEQGRGVIAHANRECGSTDGLLGVSFIPKCFFVPWMGGRGACISIQALGTNGWTWAQILQISLKVYNLFLDRYRHFYLLIHILFRMNPKLASLTK